ncbi:MAG: YihA family ribosome biosis GTP-binding protein, partial [Verrucomicrobiales bacterium]|nr:YihA family ribosome biosis GTP-binding protein [Verrucomicrobiales bacterium]
NGTRDSPNGTRDSPNGTRDSPNGTRDSPNGTGDSPSGIGGFPGGIAGFPSGIRGSPGTFGDASGGVGGTPQARTGSRHGVRGPEEISSWLFQSGRMSARVTGRIAIMNISSAIFDCSAPDLDSCPDESLPEFAFIGRSNVGKSSLLNMLAGKDGLARVSPTPGFTKLINIFTMNKRWRLVDLPGYGFAQVARKDSARFNDAVLHYLQNRKNLSGVFVLIDSSVPPQAIDLEFLKWLTGRSIALVLVFTKTDRMSPSKVEANIATFTERIAPLFEQLPEIFKCSAKTGAGRNELLGMIGDSLTAAPLKSSAETEPMTDDESALREKPIARVKHPEHLKRTRPW